MFLPRPAQQQLETKQPPDVVPMLCTTGTISKAVQPPVRDVTDASCGHSWLNPPLATGGLEGDIYKVRCLHAAARLPLHMFVLCNSAWTRL